MKHATALPPTRPFKFKQVTVRQPAYKALDADVFTKVWAENSALTERSAKALHSVGVLRQWTEGQVVLSRGQSTSTALLLVKGRLRVSVTTPEGEEQLLRWMLPGEISGLSSVFAETTYPADLVAVGPTQVLHIERTRLVDLIARDPVVAVDLLRILGLRINQLFDTLADQGIHSLEQRVWATLERIAKFNSVAVPDGVMLRVSQSDLAQAASASRQRVNQQLRHFQDQGLIRLGYRNIVLLRR
ncbi:Crp/Fnr family transcriptional regulator [Limnohabitans sp. 63ED37-2]|uniref:Crp/Fnr family transcriptional regulator n=1 Tax=Limnohabitans sp. 63ED37-2 TaxID=1678128 RepID=UPI000706B0EC|nr:Crp/Fnr family transcriptional regulator [Limnohabitans sp. 63ED37-2]ALK87410.1 cAMP-activated global transcriptional regulator CRP [Limnohabitans sp. 63ED37-2]